MSRLLMSLAPIVCLLTLSSCSHSPTDTSASREAATSVTSSREDSDREDTTTAHSENSPTSDSLARTTAPSALDIFEKRILPIFHAQRPSSCAECHLGGVDLKNYIHPEQEKTFAALVTGSTSRNRTSQRF